MVRQRLFFALAIVAIFIVCGALGETASRLAKVPVFQIAAANYVGWAKPDPVLGWRNSPGVWRADEPPHAPMTFLPDGSRVTGTPAGAAGDPIVIVGCSFAEGYGLPDNQTFAWLLQQRFPRRPILNYGTPGYGTYQSLLLLEDLIGTRKIHPAAVIYGFITLHVPRNVLTWPILEALRGFGGQRFSPPHVELRGRELRMFSPFVVSNWPLEQHSALVTLVHETELQARLSGRDRDEDEATVLLVKRMKNVAESEHARFLMATFWDDGPPGPESYRRIATALRNAGIDEIDATYSGKETAPERLYVGGSASGHPGPAVDAWWADKLSPWLARL